MVAGSCGGIPGGSLRELPSSQRPNGAGPLLFLLESSQPESVGEHLPSEGGPLALFGGDMSPKWVLQTVVKVFGCVVPSRARLDSLIPAEISTLEELLPK